MLERSGSSAEELVEILRGHGLDVCWIDEEQGSSRPLDEVDWSHGYVNLTAVGSGEVPDAVAPHPECVLPREASELVRPALNVRGSYGCTTRRARSGRRSRKGEGVERLSSRKSQSRSEAASTSGG